jgi:hypothetical protein
LNAPPFPRITAAGKTVTHQSTFGEARYDKQHYAKLSLHQYLRHKGLKMGRIYLCGSNFLADMKLEYEK